MQHPRLRWMHWTVILLFSMALWTDAVAQSTLQGSVTDATTGTAIPGATVRITDDAGNTVASTVQQGDAYTLTLNEGTYEATAYALGYAERSAPISIQEEQTTLDVALSRTFTAYASVRGTVTNEDEIPVEGARVTLEATEAIPGDSTLTLRRQYETATDAQGRYTITSVVPLAYQFTVSAEGYVTRQSGVAPGDGASETFDVRLSEGTAGPLARLEGTVRGADTESPLAGASIRLVFDAPADPPIVSDTLITGIVAHETVADENGRYRITGIDPDSTYALQVKAFGFESEVERPVQFSPGEIQRRDFSLVPIPLSSISGAVTYAPTGDPAADVLVIFSSAATGYFGARTGANGQYSVQVPDAEDYIAIVRTQGTDSAFVYTEYFDDAALFSEATRIDIRDGGTTAPDGTTLPGVNFEIPDLRQTVTTTVEGQVTDRGGQPLAGAQVTVANYNGFRDLQRFTAQSDASGRYRIQFTGPYLQRLVAWVKLDGFATTYYEDQPASYLADPIAVDVTDPSVQGIDFQMAPLGSTNANTISGRVTGNSGQPLSDVLVLAQSAASGHVNHANTDDDGLYRMALNSETYYLLFVAERHRPLYAGGDRTWDAAAPVRAMNQTIDIQLTPVPSISSGATFVGQIRSSDDTPVPGTLVLVEDEDGTLLGSALTDSQGAYRIEGVRPGTVTLRTERFGTEPATLEQIAQADALAIADFTIATDQSVDRDPTPELPSSVHLEAAYPNPFNPATTIRYRVQQPGPIRLTVYDALGRRVVTLVDDVKGAGTYTVPFDATGLPSGVYMYRLTTPSGQYARTAMLVK